MDVTTWVAFERWSELSHINDRAYKLWYKLYAIANERFWPEWISVGNITLESKVSCSKNTLNEARLELIRAGLLEYKKGKKGTFGKYKLLEIPKYGSKFDPEPDLEPDLEPDHIIRLRHRQGVAVVANARERANDDETNGELSEHWTAEFGVPPTPAQSRWLSTQQCLCQINNEVMCEAISRTALRQPQDTIAYLSGILKHWQGKSMDDIVNADFSWDNPSVAGQKGEGAQ